MKPRVGIAASIETLLNQLLALAPEQQEALSQFEHKVITIEIQVVDVRLTLIPVGQQIQVSLEEGYEPDVCISGSPIALLSLLTNKNPDFSAQQDVSIEGDLHLAQQFKAYCDGFEIDWEEHLSHYLGDVVAHALGDLARKASSWRQETKATLRSNLSEYLQEELRWLPPSAECRAWFDEVDEIRMAVDRLEARVKRLQKPQEEQE